MCFPNFDDFDLTCIDVCMFGEKILITECFKNLCHFITRNNKDIIDINNVIKHMKVKSNIILSNFNYLNFEFKRILFNSHCFSLYGSELFYLELFAFSI